MIVGPKSSVNGEKEKDVAYRDSGSTAEKVDREAGAVVRKVNVCVGSSGFKTSYSLKIS